MRAGLLGSFRLLRTPTTFLLYNKRNYNSTSQTKQQEQYNNKMNTPLVLLPGMMCDYGLWNRMLPELESIGPLYFGDLSNCSSVDEMATKVLSLSLPQKFTLIGFSMGGFVAREIERREPNRVERLILIATSSAGDSKVQSRYKAGVAHGLQNIKDEHYKGLGQKSIEQSLSPLHSTDKQMKQQILDMSVRLGRETYIKQLLMARESDTDKLKEIECPTLVIAATEDRMRSREESEEMKREIKKAEIEIIGESGHMIPIEQPAVLAKVIRSWIIKTS